MSPDELVWCPRCYDPERPLYCSADCELCHGKGRVTARAAFADQEAKSGQEHKP